MASRWDRVPDVFDHLPPRWSEAARALRESVPFGAASLLERHRPARSLSSRDFSSGPDADGLPEPVRRGLRWLDADVRGSVPSAASLLLGRSFQDSFATLLAMDRVFLPEETTVFAAGSALAGLPAAMESSPVVVAATMSERRRTVLGAWCRRLGFPWKTVTDAGAPPDEARAIVVETPNALGLLENLAAWRAAAGEHPLVVLAPDPLALFSADLPVGTFADVVVFDVAALAARGEEAAAVAVGRRCLATVHGGLVDTVRGETRLVRSDGSPAIDEPRWEPTLAAALLAAELGSAGLRRRARGVRQRRRWLESVLERRGLPPVMPPGQRFRAVRFEIPRWQERLKSALGEGFRVEDDGGWLRCALAARREDVTRLAEVLAGG